jgi:hypothetical protein
MSWQISSVQVSRDSDSCIEGHFTSPKEQNMQHVPVLGVMM